MDLVQRWQRYAKAKYQEHLTFLRRLKPSKAKQIDKAVNLLDEQAFAEMDCLACANCCKTISPRVTQTDVKRMASALRLKETEVIERYLRVDHEGDYVMNAQPCPFLGADNYCSIYEHRPRGCRDYPLTHLGNFCQRPALHAKNTLTCPVVFHVVEALKKQGS